MKCSVALVLYWRHTGARTHMCGVSGHSRAHQVMCRRKLCCQLEDQHSHTQHQHHHQEHHVQIMREDARVIIM